MLKINIHLSLKKCIFSGLSFDIDTADLRREFLLGLSEKKNKKYLGEFQVKT